MKTLHTTIKMPFTVSLTLIFAYGLLQIVVPPNVTASDEIVVIPTTQPYTVSLDDNIRPGNTPTAPAQATTPSIR